MDESSGDRAKGSTLLCGMLWRRHIDQFRSGSTAIPQLLDNRDEKPAPETGTGDTHTDSNDDAAIYAN